MIFWRCDTVFNKKEKKNIIYENTALTQDVTHNRIYCIYFHKHNITTPNYLKYR
jgi:hypothetical protein